MSKENGEKPQDKPTFDFSKLSYRQSKRMTIVAFKLQEAMKAGDIEAIETNLEEEANAFALVVTYVPASWLVPGAPSGLDWSKPESYDHIQADKVEVLKEELSQARQEASKN